MYGADATAGGMFYNQSAAGLGNIVGGAIVMGYVAGVVWLTLANRHSTI